MRNASGPQATATSLRTLMRGMQIRRLSTMETLARPLSAVSPVHRPLQLPVHTRPREWILTTTRGAEVDRCELPRGARDASPKQCSHGLARQRTSRALAARASQPQNSMAWPSSQQQRNTRTPCRQALNSHKPGVERYRLHSRAPLAGRLRRRAGWFQDFSMPHHCTRNHSRFRRAEYPRGTNSRSYACCPY